MMKLLLIIYCLTFTFCSLFGQEGRTVVGKNQFLIGQQTSLTYMINISNNSKIECKPFSTFIPSKRFNPKSKLASKEMIEVEIMQSFHDTIVKGKNNEQVWIGGYTITVWDSGYFEIPEMVVQVDSKEVVCPSTLIRVDLVAAKKGSDIYDIKEMFADLPEQSLSEKAKDFFKLNWWWFIPIIMIIILIIIYLRWKKVTKIPEKVKELSLKEKTLLAIDALEKERLWEKGKLKKHYIELSFILRSYLSSRYELNLLEKTSHESQLLLIQKGLNKETVETIGEILIQSDMVKFAKSAPDEISVLRISVLAKQIVAETSPIEFENVV